MELVVNGEKKMVETEVTTIAQLLVAMEVKMPEMVSVQKNGAFVDRAAFGDTGIAEGDEIDFLYFMGGGAS